jgi:hypothetical protein
MRSNSGSSIHLFGQIRNVTAVEHALAITAISLDELLRTEGPLFVIKKLLLSNSRTLKKASKTPFPLRFLAFVRSRHNGATHVKSI